MTREQTPAPHRSSNGDWTSLRKHESFPEFPVVTRESRRNSRKTTRFPRHCEMRPFPAAAYQGTSHVPSSNLKRYLTHLLQLIKFPKYISHLRGTPSFPALLNPSPFSPPDLDMRINSLALSGKGSRSSRHTSGRGQSHIETRAEDSWVVPHSERYQFPCPLKISRDAWAPLRM